MSCPFILVSSVATTPDTVHTRTETQHDSRLPVACNLHAATLVGANRLVPAYRIIPGVSLAMMQASENANTSLGQGSREECL